MSDAYAVLPTPANMTEASTAATLLTRFLFFIFVLLCAKALHPARMEVPLPPCQQGYGPVTLAVNAPCAKRRMRHTFGHAIDAGGLAVEAVAQFSVARGVQACPVRRINAPLSAFYVKHEQMDTLGKKGAQRGVCFIFGHSIARTARFPCFQPRETGGFAFLTFLDIFIYF